VLAALLVVEKEFTNVIWQSMGMKKPTPEFRLATSTDRNSRKLFVCLTRGTFSYIVIVSRKSHQVSRHVKRLVAA
jgi:hypothetical protein